MLAQIQAPERLRLRVRIVEKERLRLRVRIAEKERLRLRARIVEKDRLLLRVWIVEKERLRKLLSGKLDGSEPFPHQSSEMLINKAFAVALETF